MEGKPVDGLYCIQSGKVKVIKNIDGRDAIVRISSSGDLLGHYGLFTTNKHFSTVTALEDVQLCFLDKKLVSQLMQKHPDISSLFIKKLCHEMSSTKTKLSSIMNKNIRERLAELLLTLSESYGEANEDRIKLEIRLTREEMASMIGTVNETVTRFITEFKSDGLIEEEDKVIYITNQEKLRKVARVTHAS
ncbi:MAG: Crp/Fnr family transcriptional regulator [Bacteriovoracaceae bacterium]|nr:Crp/Fnr family transcriptional regulator [Bacteriovoracaceae bacterium]